MNISDKYLEVYVLKLTNSSLQHDRLVKGNSEQLKANENPFVYDHKHGRHMRNMQTKILFVLFELN